jgi:hypothetical protein
MCHDLPELRRREYTRILQIVNNALRERSLGYPPQFLLREVQQRIDQGPIDGTLTGEQVGHIRQIRVRVLLLCDEMLAAQRSGHFDPLRKLALTVDQWALEDFTRGREPGGR